MLNFKDFISFDKFITPKLIQILYIITIIVGVLSSFGMILKSYNSFYGFSPILFLSGLVGIILSILFARVFFELIIVIFKINDNLNTIAKNTGSEKNTGEEVLSSQTNQTDV